MIHVASLAAFVKKAYNEKAFQTSMEKIISQLHLDPETTGMDMVVISPKDIRLLKTKSDFLEVMKAKHHDIEVVLIYGEEDEAKDLFDTGMVLKKVQKLNLNSIKEALDNLLQERSIRQVDAIVVSKDSVHPTIEKLAKTMKINNPESKANPVVEPAVTPMPVSVKKHMEEKNIAETGFADWTVFKQLLKKDAMMRELLQENGKYQYAFEMLEVLDKKISLIFMDSAKTAEERFDAIRDIALQRAEYKDQQNHILVERLLDIIKNITLSATSTIEKKMKEMSSYLHTAERSTEPYYKQNKAELHQLMQQRLDLQLAIYEITREMTGLYQVMDEAVAEAAVTFDSGLPSDNVYINEIYAASSQQFIPENTAALTAKLIEGLQNSRLQLAGYEKSLLTLCSKAIELCKLDESIIQQQEQLIELLMAKNAEEVIITDTLLKNCMRLYIGPEGVGAHSTAITWAGILSRRHNTLLIDFTGGGKFREYGVDAISLGDFMAQRIETPLLFVEDQIEGDPEYLQKAVEVLKTRVNYYPYINILLRPEQVDLIKELSCYAASAAFITDCSKTGNASIYAAAVCVEHENMTKQMILIGAPEDPLPVLNDLNINPENYKLVTLPYIPKMKTYSCKAIPPYKDKEIVEIFEASFR